LSMTTPTIMTDLTTTMEGDTTMVDIIVTGTTITMVTDIMVDTTTITDTVTIMGDVTGRKSDATATIGTGTSTRTVTDTERQIVATVRQQYVPETAGIREKKRIPIVLSDTQIVEKGTIVVKEQAEIDLLQKIAEVKLQETAVIEDRREGSALFSFYGAIVSNTFPTISPPNVPRI